MANNFYCRESETKESKLDMQDKINQLIMENQKLTQDLATLWSQFKIVKERLENLLKERKEWTEKSTKK